MKKVMFNFYIGEEIKERLLIITKSKGVTIAAKINELILKYVEEIENKPKVVVENVDNSLSEEEEQNLLEWEKRKRQEDPDFFKNK